MGAPALLSIAYAQRIRRPTRLQWTTSFHGLNQHCELIDHPVDARGLLLCLIGKLDMLERKEKDLMVCLVALVKSPPAQPSALRGVHDETLGE
jgi:hypothetical protein